ELSTSLGQGKRIAQIARRRDAGAHEWRMRATETAQDRCRNARMVEHVLEHQASRRPWRDDEGGHARSQLAVVLPDEGHRIRRRLHMIVKAAVLVIDD